MNKSKNLKNNDLEWVKFPVSGAASYLLETVSPDGLAMYMAIVRRLCSFSPFVAFKVSDLMDILAWSESKVKRVLSEIKTAGLLVVYSSEYARTYGTFYMLNPYIIDVCGTENNSRRMRSIWLDLVGSDCLPDEDRTKSTVSNKITAPFPDGNGRVDITIMTNIFRNDL